MIRVAYLCEFSTYLGGERSLLTFLRAAKDICDPVVVCPQSGKFVDALDRASVERLAWTTRAKEDDAPLLAELKTRGVEIIHGNSLSLAEVVFRTSHALSIPGVLHVRDIASLSRRRWEIINQLSAVVGVSGAVAKWLREGGVDHDRLHQVYNSVDLSDLANRQTKKTVEELGLPANRRLIACVGQICLRKGQDLFLEACHRIAHKMADADFVVIGERYSVKEESVTFENRLRAMADSSPLAGRVHWLGYRHDVADLMRFVNLVVVPSRQEPLSRVLIESLAVGVPCVASRVGGNEEILHDGEFGLTFTSGDANELADQAMKILRDPTFSERTRLHGPAYIAERFSPAEQVDRILGIYRSILSKR